MKTNNIPNHLTYDETKVDESELEKLKRDFLAVTDARCKVRIREIINIMEE